MLHGYSSTSFKLSATKKNCQKPPVCPSHPRYRFAAHQIWQILLKFVIAIVPFSKILQQFQILWIHTDQCVGPALVTALQHLRGRIDILHSHYPQQEHQLLWLWRLYIFFKILWYFEILWIHTDWYLSLDSLPHSTNSIDYGVTVLII